MERYKDIDVPEFIKKKTKPLLAKEEQEEEIEKAFIKGGLVAILEVFIIVILFIILALIEAM